MKRPCVPKYDEEQVNLFDRRLLNEVRNRLRELVRRGLPTVVQQGVLVQISLLGAPLRENSCDA